jgi:hypothetical protein
MIDFLKESLWRQYGASIDMLKKAISMWPDEHWNTDKKFFYNAYHCLVFLDYYLTIPSESFSSKLPFTLTEEGNIPADAIDDVIPDRIYNKQELLGYLQSSRDKCHRVISNLTVEGLEDRWQEQDGDRDYSVFELFLYNMRHTQHHAAQLNLLLRQKIGDAPRWISRAADAL